MTHYHQYEYREPQPRNSELVRDRLRQRPKQTFETIDAAVAWHAQWMSEVPRPPGYWGVGTAQDEAPEPEIVAHPERVPTAQEIRAMDTRLRRQRVATMVAPFGPRPDETSEEYRERMRVEGEARTVEFTRSQLAQENAVVDSFWSGAQVICATIIPCPPRPIPGFPEPPPCPLGRAS